MKPTILLDFDGTLGLGNGPVTAYARAISSRAGGEEFFLPRLLCNRRVRGGGG